MMSALPQSPAPTGLPAILAALGAVAPAGDAAGGFDRLLTAAPIPVPVAETTGLPPSAVARQPLPLAQMPPAAASAVELDVEIDVESVAEAPVADASTAEVPIIKTPATPGDAAAAAAAAASLLVAFTGGPGGKAQPAAAPVAKGAPSLPAADSNGDTAPAVPDTAIADTTVQPIPGWSPMPVATPNAATVTPTGTGEPAAMPARAALPQAQAAPALASNMFAAAEAAPVKPAPDESGASMTILFAQPAASGSVAAPETAGPAPVAERVLDLASDDGWIDRLAADIAATKSQSGDISFRLMPRYLGRLDVAMLAGDEGVSLRLDTQHEATATIVAAAQGRLVDDLRQQGVRVAEAHVTHTPGESGRQSQQDQGRAPARDAAHLIETATERATPRDAETPADRRGRFA